MGAELTGARGIAGGFARRRHLRSGEETRTGAGAISGLVVQRRHLKAALEDVQAAAVGLRPGSSEFCTKRNVSDSRRRGSGVRLVIRQMRMKAGFEDTRMETAGRCVSVRVELVQNR